MGDHITSKAMIVDSAGLENRLARKFDLTIALAVCFYMYKSYFCYLNPPLLP